jgi:hypothetical protein
VQAALPDRAAFLAGPIASAVTGGLHTALTRTAQSPQFADVWKGVNSRVHQQFMNLVTKYQGDGQISISDVYQQLASRLQDTRLAVLASKPLPPKIGNIQILDAQWLPVAHNVVVTLSWAVPVGALVALLGFAVAVWWSPRRRRTLLAVALSAAFTLGVVNIAIRLVQQIRQSHIPDPTYRAAAQAVNAAVIGPLITQTRVWLVLALVVAVAAWITGPFAAAHSLRAWLGRASAATMHATGDLGAGTPAVRWLRRRRRLVEFALVALAVVVLMFLTPLTIAIITWTAAILIVLVVLVEIITSTTPAPSQA